jgi:uncharacterized SAM-binding protein YcdF (DUF218 family)
MIITVIFIVVIFTILLVLLLLIMVPILLDMLSGVSLASALAREIVWCSLQKAANVLTSIILGAAVG